MDRQEQIDKRVEERVKEDLTAIDMDERYDSMLDECYPCQIGSMTFDASRILKEFDPIAYRCGFNDFLDGEDVEEIDGEYYDRADVETIRDEVEEELDEEDAGE